MLKGRLGLEKARIPHADRHGLLWLSRGELCVIDGCLHFLRGKDSLTPGIDQIPHQAVSMILLGPGSSVTHDALRLLARHGTLLAAVGEDGVRSYTAPPLLPDRSDGPGARPNCGATHGGASAWRATCTPCAWGRRCRTATSIPCAALKARGSKPSTA